MSDTIVNEVPKSKTKANEHKKCEICGSQYSNNTRTNHLNSDKHKKGIELTEKNKKISELENRIIELCNESDIVKQCESYRITVEKLNAQIKEYEHKILTIKEYEKSVADLKSKLDNVTNIIS
jgi:hypothetical protein